MSQPDYYEALAEAKEQYEKDLRAYKEMYPEEDFLPFEDWLEEECQKHRDS